MLTYKQKPPCGGFCLVVGSWRLFAYWLDLDLLDLVFLDYLWNGNGKYAVLERGIGLLGNC